MNKKTRIEDWDRMFKTLTDPDMQAKEKRKEEQKKRVEMKKADTGL